VWKLESEEPMAVTTPRLFIEPIFGSRRAPLTYRPEPEKFQPDLFIAQLPLFNTAYADRTNPRKRTARSDQTGSLLRDN
jgi:hypothetical protein